MYGVEDNLKDIQRHIDSEQNFVIVLSVSRDLV